MQAERSKKMKGRRKSTHGTLINPDELTNHSNEFIDVFKDGNKNKGINESSADESEMDLNADEINILKEFEKND